MADGKRRKEGDARVSTEKEKIRCIPTVIDGSKNTRVVV